MTGFINIFVYSLSQSQSITALSLLYPLHKSLGHVIRFLATNLSQKQSLQITMKSSCHLLFNHLGLPTLQNSTQFSSSCSLIPVAQVKVTLRLTVGQSVSLGIEPHLGLVTRYFLFFLTVTVLFLVGRPLWREAGSVFCIWCWLLPVHSLSGPSLLVLATICYGLRFETSLFFASYDSQGHGGGIRHRLHTGLSPWLQRDSRYIDSGRNPRKTHVACPCSHWPVTQHWAWRRSHRKHLFC
jgi:hypothetical protein